MKFFKFFFALMFSLTFLFPSQKTTITGNIEYYYMSRLSNSDIVNIPFRLLNLNIYHQRDSFDINGTYALEYRPRSSTHFPTNDNPTDFNNVLRELYINYYFDQGEFSIGKKIFTWGNADENSPIDNLNPYDYYYLLNGTNERKLGIYSGSFDFYFADNWKISGMFSPMHNTSRFPINDSEYPIGLPVSPSKNQFLDIDKSYENGIYLQNSRNNFEITISHFSGYDRAFTVAGVILYESNGILRTDLRYSYRKTSVNNLGFVLLFDAFTIRSDISFFKTSDKTDDTAFLESKYSQQDILVQINPNFDFQIMDNCGFDDDNDGINENTRKCFFPFKENAEYNQGVFQLELPLPKDYQINFQYFEYYIKKYENKYKGYDLLGNNAQLPNIGDINLDDIGTKELFMPGMGAPYSLLSKRLGFISLEKILLDNDLKLTFSTLYDLDKGDGHLYAFESEYEFSNGITALIGFNKINGDSSQGPLYRLNSMEDFSSFRTQLTYNF